MVLSQDECVALPVLTGCVMEQPCELPDLGPVPCMCGNSAEMYQLHFHYFFWWQNILLPHFIWFICLTSPWCGHHNTLGPSTRVSELSPAGTVPNAFNDRYDVSDCTNVPRLDHWSVRNADFADLFEKSMRVFCCNSPSTHMCNQLHQTREGSYFKQNNQWRSACKINRIEPGASRTHLQHALSGTTWKQSLSDGEHKRPDLSEAYFFPCLSMKRMFLLSSTSSKSMLCNFFNCHLNVMSMRVDPSSRYRARQGQSMGLVSGLILEVSQTSLSCAKLWR